MHRTILLLGAKGQLGTFLIKGFENDPQFSLIAYSRIEVDLLDKNQLALSLEQTPFDILINGAAYNDTEKASKEPDIAFRINRDAVLEMARFCQLRKKVFIHVSTDYVFDGEKRAAYTEEDTVNPLSIYGRSKEEGESLALKECESTYIFRTASLYGGEGNHFVRKLWKLASIKQSLHVIDEITMSPTYAKSLASMIILCLKKEAPFGVYHAVNRGNVSWCTFANKIFQISKLPIEVIPCLANYFPSLIQRPLYSALETKKIEGIVGYIPSWDEALEEYIK